MRTAAGRQTKNHLINDAVRRFQHIARARHEEETPPAPKVITISRQLGAGGRRVAEVLAEKLGWPLYDKEILELLAEKSGLSFQAEMFESLDERRQHEIERVVSTLVGRMDQFTYLYLLPKAILTLAQTDCIILGRGAHLILPEAFKIRIEASDELRVKNLIKFESLSEDEARRQVAASDKSRARFIRDMCASLPEKIRWCKEQRMYELTLNTDVFSIADSAEIALLAAQKRFAASFKELHHSPPAAPPAK